MPRWILFLIACSLTPSLAAASATVTLYILSYTPAYTPSQQVPLVIPSCGHFTVPYADVYKVSSVTRNILRVAQSPSTMPVSDANAGFNLNLRFY